VNPIVEVEELSVDYGNGPVVDRISLAIEPGEILGIVGPNGAGKSSLVKAIIGLAPISTGVIRIDGDDVARERTERRARRGLFYVPDDRGIFGPLTVASHLTLAQRRRLSVQEADDVRVALPELERLWRRTAGSLSGGEAQLLSLAMAFVSSPRILLIDELSFGLAPVIINRLGEAILELAHANGVAVLMVEQMLELAMRLSDRIIVLRQSIVYEESAETVREDSTALRNAYLG
jgi:branched-chain amino acid transport system ATP-binding protein